MSRLSLILLLAVFSSHCNLGYTSATTTKTVLLEVPKAEPVVYNQNASSTNESEPVSKSTDAPVTTPEVPTSTPKTNTTTTSTTTPSTTSTTTSTTTTSTTTTSPAPTPKPTPTPAPTPTPTPPHPDQGLWSYTDKTLNKTCIVLQFAAQLNVTYSKKVENAYPLANVLINIPKNASVVNGTCTDDQWMTISWTVFNTSIANNMTLVYHMNNVTKNYSLKSLNISLSPELFVNASTSGPIELYHGEEWSTPLSTSYRCAATTRLNMTGEGNNFGALSVTALQEEAYRNVPGTSFSAARECGGSDVPDAVPIAVGCALGGLVLVVLVAYLVARRRSAARGYLSM